MDVSPYRRRSSPCYPGNRDRQPAGLARSQSDVLRPAGFAPPLHGTPARVNPFSLRQDLNGGRCKLLDTPSKSVISLTFTLPALRDPCAPQRLCGSLPRRCQSLPCTPELGRTPSLSGELDGLGLEEGRARPAEDWAEAGLKNERPLGEEGEGGASKEEVIPKEEAGCLVELEMVSLERLEEEEEEEEGACVSEPMDCTKSPVDPVCGTPPPAPSSPALHTNGWTLPIFRGPPLLPPLPRPDNNNRLAAVTGRHHGGAGSSNGYGEGQFATGDPGGVPEQDEVISCPSCCLVGLNFPSVCLRGPAAVPPRRQRASLLCRRPYRNLNGPISGSSSPASGSGSAPSPVRVLLCRGTNGLGGAGLSLPHETGQSLPEAQSYVS